MVEYADIVLKLKKKEAFSLLELADGKRTNMKAVREILLKILKNELNAIAFTSDVEKYKYVYKIFKYLEEPFNETEKRKIIKSLEECQSICERRLKQAKSSKGKKNRGKVIEKIKDVIDVTIINLNYYDVKDNSEETSYNLLIYLIFELQNYNYIFEIIKTHPDKIVAKNAQGKYLIEELIDRYLCEMVKNENAGYYIYLEKIIKLFIDNPKLNLSSEDTIKIVNKLNHSINEINNISIPDDRKRKIIFFINEVIMYIDKKSYGKEEIIRSINNLLNQDRELSKENNYLIEYFLNDLAEIIDKQKFDFKTIEHLNSYIMTIDKLSIPNDIKEEITSLTYIIINYLSNNIANNQMHKYLDYKYSITTGFDDDVLEEAKNTVILNGEEVLDCTNKFTLTIDGKKTRVYDDAISLEKFDDQTRLLGIYLADVASFVPRGSAIDLKALSLGETIIGKSHSMLPLDLVDKLSLDKNSPKRAVGYFFLFDKDMKCIGFRVKKCLIKIGENYDYEKTNILLTDSRNIEEVKTLKEMLLVSQQLSKLSYAKAEFRTLKNLKRRLTQDEFNDSSASLMIRDFMVYINSYIASFFASHPEIPFIYRNNISNYSDDMIDRINKIILYDSDYEYVIPYINAICPPSFYSIVNKGHTGLNLSAYCHASNPLRNYCSLEIQRLIEKYMINKDMQVPANEKQRLNDLSNYINSRINLNDEYEEELYKLKSKQKSLTN